LPLAGPREPITRFFLDWLEEIDRQTEGDKESYIFPSAYPFGNIDWHIPLRRQRAHQIIKRTTGKMPHYFRGVCESYAGKILFENDPYQLRDFMGIKSVESVVPYVDSRFRQALEKELKT
jgi:hypothetical protein